MENYGIAQFLIHIFASIGFGTCFLIVLCFIFADYIKWEDMDE